jgi:type I restriction enzyme M protein
MVSKLSVNGVGCLILANGALSSDNDEYKIRKQLIENDLVEAIIVLPINMFYTTDISVTIWIFNRNKKARTLNKNGKIFEYRDRTGEILFLDLRRKGEPFEKKYIAFSEDDIKTVAETYHNWQSVKKDELYSDIKEYCASVKKEDLEDYSLIPSRYIEFDRNLEIADFDSKMQELQDEFRKLFDEEATSRAELLKVMEEIGYGI